MSDPQVPSPGDEPEAPPRTPFDNPLFLPVLLWIFAAWFGYDAFFNADEHMQKPTTLWFNRIGFPLLLVLAVRFTLRGLRERREQMEGDEARRSTGPSAGE